jgi:hypothetical protein
MLLQPQESVLHIKVRHNTMQAQALNNNKWEENKYKRLHSPLKVVLQMLKKYTAVGIPLPALRTADLGTSVHIDHKHQLSRRSNQKLI